MNSARGSADEPFALCHFAGPPPGRHPANRFGRPPAGPQGPRGRSIFRTKREYLCGAAPQTRGEPVRGRRQPVSGGGGPSRSPTGPTSDRPGVPPAGNRATLPPPSRGRATGAAGSASPQALSTRLPLQGGTAVPARGCPKAFVREQLTPWSGDATFSVCKLDFTSFTKIASSGSEGRSARRAAPGVSWPTSCACARTGATGRAIFALPRRGRSCRSSPGNSGLPCRRRKSACRRKRRPGIFLSLRCGLAEEVTLEPTSGGGPTGSGGAMETHHPRAQPPGAQLGYWIVSSRYGRLGGIGFCAASWHQKACDEFVGWSADARVANLQLMVNRFLLLPGVRVHELASHVLDLAATRLPGDWEAAYGVRPLMAYTYVSPDQPCYRAARWERCGRPTSGLPPGAAARGVARSVKPLAADWKERLRREPERTLGFAPKASPSDDWGSTGAERADAPGAAWWGVRGKRVPANRCRYPDKEEAAHRLLSNPRVRHVIPQGMHGRALPQGARRSGGTRRC